MVWRQSCEREQPVGPRAILQKPTKRGQCNGFSTKSLIAVIFVNCQAPQFGLERSKFWFLYSGVVLVVAKRVMVVEDNDLNRKLFCDVLKASGFEVVPVADGQNVMATARKFDPHLVIMDIQLPNISGLDLIAELKADTALSKTPVLAVTAYAGKGDEDRIRGAGAHDYLAKPVSITPFMNAVKALIEGPEESA